MHPARFRSLLYLWFLPLLFSCKEKTVTRSYYFWRNSNEIQPAEKAFLRQHGVKKLYIKYMDIDWNEIHQAHPAIIGWYHDMAYDVDKMQVTAVPVIFMTNKTFQHTDSAGIPLLATRILRKCIPGFDSLAVPEQGDRYWYLQPAEIQFDCDWSASTRNRYFFFLHCIRKQLGARKIILSATIRLHQYKYPERTGIPPVDRGMLMVYNISKVTDYSATNSIYDNEKAAAYFKEGRKYKLPLDIALPAYSWGIFFRHGRFYMIENGLTADTLQKSTFLRRTSANFYKVTTDTVFCNLYLRPGDEIKIEQVDEATLLQAAQMAGKAINTDSFSVALFELSQHEIKNYRHEVVDQVYSGFEH